jgi:hypothetical protein
VHVTLRGGILARGYRAIRRPRPGAVGGVRRVHVLRVEILRYHARGVGRDERRRREIRGVIAMVGDGGDDLLPPPVCPNCGNELHLDQSVCANCGYIRPSSGMVVPASSGIGGTGGALIGCGGAIVAVVLCVTLYGFLSSFLRPQALFLFIEAILAVGLFLAFRKIIARNRHAREALIAFAIVFIVLGGAFAACTRMFNPGP